VQEAEWHTGACTPLAQGLDLRRLPLHEADYSLATGGKNQFQLMLKDRLASE
jgi:hypothetical protein